MCELNYDCDYEPYYDGDYSDCNQEYDTYDTYSDCYTTYEQYEAPVVEELNSNTGSSHDENFSKALKSEKPK